MRESDLIRQALEEELLQKERVRTACLAATIGERRRIPMKKTGDCAGGMRGADTAAVGIGLCGGGRERVPDGGGILG